MRLVLDAAPEIGVSYGIIVNKVSNRGFDTFKNQGIAAEFLNRLFAGIPRDRRCPVPCITYLKSCRDFEDEDNKLIPTGLFETLQGFSLEVNTFRIKLV